MTNSSTASRATAAQRSVPLGNSELEAQLETLRKQAKTDNVAYDLVKCNENLYAKNLEIKNLQDEIKELNINFTIRTKNLEDQKVNDMKNVRARNDWFHPWKPVPIDGFIIMCYIIGDIDDGPKG